MLIRFSNRRQVLREHIHFDRAGANNDDVGFDRQHRRRLFATQLPLYTDRSDFRLRSGCRCLGSFGLVYIYFLPCRCTESNCALTPALSNAYHNLACG